MRYYKYTLVNAVSGPLELYYAPQEWSSDQVFYERSMIYWGIFRSFSTKELTFIRDGGAFLKEIFDREGSEGICQYNVQGLNVTNYTYETLYSGVVDFSTYKYVIGSSGTFVKVQVIDNSFVSKIKNREGMDVDLKKLFDVDGVAITPFANEGKTISIPARTDYLQAHLSCYETGVVNRAFNLQVVDKEENSVVSVEDPSNRLLLAASFFRPAFSTNLNNQVVIAGHLTYASGVNTIEINQKRYDSGGSLQDTTLILSQSNPPGYGNITVDVDAHFPSNYCVNGDYVVIEIMHTGTPDTCNLQVDVYPEYPHLITPVAYDVFGYKYHEAFYRILQAITGVAAPFYSDILGRSDSEVITYLTDGYLSPGIITDGMFIRGELTGSLNVSLKNLFTSLSAIYPLSLGIETFITDTFESVRKIRIEPLQHVFSNAIFLTIEDASEIIEEVAIDLMFNEINIGFSKANNSAFNTAKSRYEYNGSVKYGTKITSQQNTLSQTSPYRADGNGLFTALQKHVSIAAGESTEYDDNNFLINYIPASNVIARHENYSAVSGTGNSQNNYNLDYQPARNLMRWGSFIKAFLTKNITSILSFISSEYSSAASSQRTDETVPAVEGTDINVSDLDTNFFENIYYSFNFKVTNSIMQSMALEIAGVPAYYGMVRFREKPTEDYRYGWIMRFESRKPDIEGFGSMKLLKAAATSGTGLKLMNTEGKYITNEDSKQIIIVE